MIPTKKRKRNKEEQIYGVFMDDNDHEKSAPDRLSKSMKFVKGGAIGTKQQSENKKTFEEVEEGFEENEVEEDENDEEIDSELEYQEELKQAHKKIERDLGETFSKPFPSSSKQVRFAPQQKDNHDHSYRKTSTDFDEDSQDEEGRLGGVQPFVEENGTAVHEQPQQKIHSKTSQSFMQGQKEEMQQTIGNKSKAASSFKFGTGSTRNSLQGAKPEFEKYTKGIGSKLLLKMGWEPGKGLGPQNQGINRPIEVKNRGKQIGLGFIDEKTEQQKEDEQASAKNRLGKLSLDEEHEPIGVGEESVTTSATPQNWKKAKRGRARPKIVTETETTALPQGVFITDMRGEVPKVISDVSMGVDKSKTSTVEQLTVYNFLPELQYNLRTLSDLKESELFNVEQQRRQEKQKLKSGQTQQYRLQKTIEMEEATSKRLESIMFIISKLENKVNEGSLELATVATAFVLFHSKYLNEYFSHKLYFLVSSFVLPLLKLKFANWDPLLQPKLGIEDWSKWYELLYLNKEVLKASLDENEEEERDSKSRHEMRQQIQDHNSDVYIQLICEVILPKLRNSIINVWEPNQDFKSSAFELVNTWKDILPEIVLENVYDQLLMPKLMHSIEKWDSKSTKNVSIESWFHEWLPLLGISRLVSLFPLIRNKLVQSLVGWKPPVDTDRVVSLIGAWKEVFDDSSFQSLLKQSIIPKLEEMMSSFQVNPANQQIKPFESFMTFKNIIPIDKMVHILHIHFFPKFHFALWTWMKSESPNFIEIHNWYVGWKSQLISLSDSLRVRTHFNIALNFINESIKNNKKYSFTYPPLENDFEAQEDQIREEQHQQQQQQHQRQQTKSTEISKEPSFKEIIERFGDEHEISLIPTSKRHEGKQVYNFGKHQIFIDQQVLFKYQPSTNQWVPVSLDSLI